MTNIDAKLTDLSAEMEAAIAAEMDASDDADDGRIVNGVYLNSPLGRAYAATDAIVARIIATPASTLDGLRVKARAMNFLAGGYFLLEDDAETSSERIERSIVRDLLAA